MSIPIISCVFFHIFSQFSLILLLEICQVVFHLQVAVQQNLRFWFVLFLKISFLFRCQIWIYRPPIWIETTRKKKHAKTIKNMWNEGKWICPQDLFACGQNLLPVALFFFQGLILCLWSSGVKSELEKQLNYPMVKPFFFPLLFL